MAAESRRRCGRPGANARSPGGKRHPLLPAVMSKNAASFAYRNGFKKPSGRPPALSSASLISET
jgi:hypothetical protein